MGFVMISDRFYCSLEACKIGNRGVGLLMRSLCYVSLNHTGGFISRDALKSLSSDISPKTRKKIIDDMIAVSLLAKSGNGFYFPPSHLWAIQTDQSIFEQMRKQARREHAATIFERDAHRCVYCGCPDDLTLDHVLPLSRGGTNDLDNLTTACRTCNSSKGSRTVEEWQR